MTKICNVCRQEKPLSEFYKDRSRKDGLSFRCRPCNKLANTQFRQQNPKYNRQWKQKNKEKYRVQRKEYYESHRTQILAQQKGYYKRNKLWWVKYSRHRTRTDLLFRLRKNLRVRLCAAIKGKQKTGSAVSDLGCSVEELKQYLESRFQPGMTWDNWGVHGWHVDHIKPLNSFNLADRRQLLEACHFSNLQPLWAGENITKGAKHET